MLHKIIKAQGGIVHYFTNNIENRTTLFFCHGLTADYTIFEKQYEYFKDQYNLISNIDNYLCVETENDLKFGKSLSDSYKGIRIIKNDKFMTSDKKTNAGEILKFILKDK